MIEKQTALDWKYVSGKTVLDIENFWGAWWLHQLAHVPDSGVLKGEAHGGREPAQSRGLMAKPLLHDSCWFG